MEDVVLLWMVMSCAPPPVDPPAPAGRRMPPHGEEGLVAVRALRAGDLDGTRGAGGILGQKVPTPALPDALGGYLAAMRRAGQLAAEAPDAPAAASALATLADQCGICHEQAEVQPEPAAGADAVEQAWLAVAVRDEARWAGAAESLPLRGNTWTVRRIALQEVLVPAP